MSCHVSLRRGYRWSAHCCSGFSQGACLALEYAARNPKPYGGVIGLSGALIENGDEPRVYTGNSDNGALSFSVAARPIPMCRGNASSEAPRSFVAWAQR